MANTKMSEFIDADTFREVFFNCDYKQQYIDTGVRDKVFVPTEHDSSKRDERYFDAVEQLEEFYKRQKEAGEYQDFVSPKYREKFLEYMSYDLRQDVRELWDKKQTQEWKDAVALNKLMQAIEANYQVDNDSQYKDYNPKGKSYSETMGYERYKMVMYSDALIQAAIENFPKFREHAVDCIKQIELEDKREQLLTRVEKVEHILNPNGYNGGEKIDKKTLEELEKEMVANFNQRKKDRNLQLDVPDFMRKDFFDRLAAGIGDVGLDYRNVIATGWEKDSASNEKFRMTQTGLYRINDYLKQGDDVSKMALLEEMCALSPDFNKRANDVLFTLQKEEQERISKVDAAMVKDTEVLLNNIKLFTRGEECELHIAENFDFKFYLPKSNTIQEKPLEDFYKSEEFQKRFALEIEKTVENTPKLKSAIEELRTSEALKRVNHFTDHDYDRENELMMMVFSDKKFERWRDESVVNDLHYKMGLQFNLKGIAEKVRDDMFRENVEKLGRPESLFAVEKIETKDGKSVATLQFNFEENGNLCYGAKQTVTLPANYSKNPESVIKILAKIGQEYEYSNRMQGAVKQEVYANSIGKNGKLENNSVEPPSYVKTWATEFVIENYQRTIEHTQNVNDKMKQLKEFEAKVKRRESRYFGLGGTIDKLFNKDQIRKEQRIRKSLHDAIENEKKQSQSYADKLESKPSYMDRVEKKINKLFSKPSQEQKRDAIPVNLAPDEKENSQSRTTTQTM